MDRAAFGHEQERRALAGAAGLALDGEIVRRGGLDWSPAIGFVGDLHCDADGLEALLRRGRGLGITDWVLLGDLEYRPTHPASQALLDRLPAIVEETGAQLRFIRGNHDEADVLSVLADDAKEPVEVAPGLELLPDGLVWELHGLRLLVAGGARTIDASRGPEWSPNEAMSAATLARCMDAGEVDVVLAHDCPGEVPIARRHRRWRPGKDHRSKMSQLARSARPRWWISGHYHERLSALINLGQAPRCRVEILDRSGTGDNSFFVATSDSLKRTGDDEQLTVRPGKTRPNVVMVAPSLV